jgi:hypothetical protein
VVFLSPAWIRRPQQGAFMRQVTIIFALTAMLAGTAMSQGTAAPVDPSGTTREMPKGIKAVFDYLTMAGTSSAAEFKPLSRREQTQIYLKSLINPVWYLKGGFSAGIDQLNDKPREWEQGASGYGKRFGNIMGQYAIQRTTTFGVATLLHEDNRYFGSGKKGFWRRTGYALSSSILARQDNGRRYPSVSLISGYAAGAFLSRTWQPPSTHSAGDGAVSFGTSMGYHALTSVVKEFLPDVVRPLLKRR